MKKNQMKPKRIIIVFVTIGLVLIFFGLLLTPVSGLPRNKRVRCKVDLLMLHAEIANYQNEFGSYPTGDCAQVLKKLFGDNPQKIEFLRPKNMPINLAGELLDP
jgi:hypothetical protein